MRVSRGANHILNSFAHFMQSPRWLTLVSLVLAWSTALGSSSAAETPAPQPQVEEYNRLDPAARYRWLEHLLRNRMEHAVRIYLAPEPLAEEEKYIGSILSRAMAGRKLTDDGLQSILAKVDEHERNAVSHLARDYRIAVYQAFRTERDEFERRMAAWRVVYQAWQAAGERGEDLRLLMQWLQGATSRMRAGQVAKLPAIPKFGQPQPVLAAERPATPAPTALPVPREPAKTPSAEPAVAHVVRKPAIADTLRGRLPTTPRAPIRPTPLAPREAAESPQQSAPQVALRSTPRPSTVNSVPGVSPHQVMVPSAVEEPLVAPPLPTAPDQTVIAPTPAKTPVAAPTRTTRAPITTTPNTAAPSPPPIESTVTVPSAPAKIDRQPVTSGPALVARRNVEPVATDSPTIPAEPVAPVPVAPAPVAQGPAGSRDGVLREDSGGVRIDLSELQARVAGYNLALAALADRLDDGHMWESEQLMPALDELSDLNRRGADLKLYWYLLAPKDRSGMAEIQSPDSVLALLGAKIFASRNKLLHSIYEGTVEEKQAKLAELDKLSQRLARLGTTAARRIEPQDEAQR